MGKYLQFYTERVCLCKPVLRACKRHVMRNSVIWFCLQADLLSYIFICHQTAMVRV